MPVFSIQTPRGDTVDIDAPDQQAAVRGAQTWDMEDHATSEAQRLGVDPKIALGILHQESGANPDVQPSSAGAIGPMQLMPGTAKDLGVDPADPYQNITGGLTYYKQQRDRFGSDDLALAAYNAGPGAVQKHGGIPPYKQTQDYVRNILGAGYQPPQAPDATPAPQAAPPAANGQLPEVTDAETGKAYATPGVQRGLQQLLASGQLDPSARPGSKAFPRGWKPGFQADPGEWYVDQDGGLKQMAGGDAPAYDFSKSLTDPISNSADALKRDLGRWKDAESHAPKGLMGLIPGFSDADKALGSTVMDAAGLAGSVMGGEAINAGIVEPGSRLLDAIPMDAYSAPHLYVDHSGVHIRPAQRLNDAEKHQANVDIMNTALTGARPATAGPFAPELPQRAGPRVTPEQLRAQADALYTELRNRNVQFSPQAVGSLNQGLSDLLNSEGRNLYPTHANWAGQVAETMRTNPTVEGLDKVRSKLQQALTTPTANTTPDQLRVGSAMVDEIDQFMAAAARHPQAMTTGNGNMGQVGQLLTQARDTWRRMRNVQTVENLAESAGIRNSTTHMGGNAQNFTKQKLRDFIDPTKNKALSGLSPAELDQLRRVVVGTPTTNVLKALGNLSPTKGVGALANTIAAGMFGPHGPMVMAPIGFGANIAGARLQGAQLERLIRMLAGGGPVPRAPLPQTVRLASPAGLVGASVIASPLLQRPVQKESARTRH